MNRRSIASLAGVALPPVAVLVLGLWAWETYCTVYDVPKYLVPRPSVILEAARDPDRQLLAATWWTARAAAAGWIASVVVGVATALAFGSSKWLRRAFFPYAVVFQTVPIVAIAPLIILWYGTGFRSVVIVAFVISVFPVVSTTTLGLTRVDGRWLELFESYGATGWATLVKLRIPLAVPHVVAGARIAAGLAVVGAIVGEFFVGQGVTHFGLGFLIQRTKDQMNTPALFAAVLAATALGLCWFVVTGLVGRAVLAVYAPEQREI